MLGEYIASDNTGLLLHLNGNSNDTSGNSNNGSDTNVSYDNGALGNQSLSITDDDQYVEIANPTNCDIGSSFTISFFHKNTNPSSFQAQMSSFGNSDLQWEMQTQSSAIKLVKQGEGSGTVPSNSISIPDNTKFHNYIFTYDGTTYKGYRDGTNIFSTAATFNLTPTTVTKLWIGSREGSFRMYGFIDELIFEKGTDWNAQKVQKYYTYALGRFNN